jgi:hypothetical protein
MTRPIAGTARKTQMTTASAPQAIELLVVLMAVFPLLHWISQAISDSLVKVSVLLLKVTFFSSETFSLPYFDTRYRLGTTNI